MTKIKATQESGRSMVEMLGVLAIIGVLSVGGIAGYSQAMGKFKVSKTMDQIQTMITNIRTLYASQRNYGSLATAQAYQLGILTDETYDGSNGVNPYGGKITIGTANSSRTFTIKYESLPSDACVKLATADWGADASSGLVSIKLGGGTEKTFTWATSTNVNAESDAVLPVSLTNALTGCGVGSAGSSIEWSYR